MDSAITARQREIITLLALEGVNQAEIASLLSVDLKAVQVIANLAPYGLTVRQIDAITMIGQGLGRKQIAHRLGISYDTLDSYLQGASKRIGVSGSVALALFAIRSGLVDPSSIERQK